MKQHIKNIITIVMALSFALVFYTYSAVAQEERPIRVGFPAQEGLTMRNESGDYSGYTYDYLLEVAQYTGWTYEFVELEGTIDEQLAEMLRMLEDGELDIMGTIGYSEQLAKIYDFPSENYGNAYYVIAIRNDEDRIDEYNLSDYKGLKVALLRQAKNSNEKFSQYTKLNGIDYETVWCDDGKEAYEKVNSGEADALIDKDLALESSLRPIAKFSPTPFYFAVTKGNTHIINELNQAITYISEINPMLQANLYNKYFSRTSHQLILNSKEKAYIEENPTLKVLVHDGFGPLQYYDENNEIRGVAKDLLNGIAEKTGWSLEYLYSNNYNEFEKSILDNKADLILSVTYDYNTALQDDILLSTPYLETEMVLIARDKINASDLSGRTLAVYKGERKEKEGQNSTYVKYYDSIEDSLDAVEKGECDYTYANSYAASFYQRKNRHSHTIIYPQAGRDSVKYCIGILRKNDKLLSAILNKGINTVDPNELEHYIYDNAQQNQQVTLQTFVEDNPIAFMGSILFISICLIALLYSHYQSQMKMKKQIELENTRYRYLSDILKEVTFTYDYNKDSLELSQEGIRLFDANAYIEHYSQYSRKDSPNVTMPSLMELLEQKKDLDMEIQVKPSGGELEWFRIVIKIVMDGNKAVSAIGRMQNIHQEKLEKEQLVEKSRIDGLTGIYNNVTMKRKITDLLAKEKGPLALLITDLDDFKGINDRYGHYTGDQVLIQTASSLNKVFGEDGFVGRLGGDEFIVCVRYQGEAWMNQKCREFSKVLDSAIASAGCPVSTVSIGISLSRDGDDFTALYQRADVSLYAVKNSGKNNFKIES